jgi:hypothetical protein
LGFAPLGGRQHWLRFTLPQLVEGVARSGAAYDASLGWPAQIGFRAGLCAPFPPYDFEREAAAPFLELPLLAMDRALLGTSHTGAADQLSQALAASRQYGWGGVSLLWHPTAFGGGQFPKVIGEAYWRLLDAGTDNFVSGASMAQAVWNRYSQAGLLPGRRFA